MPGAMARWAAVGLAIACLLSSAPARPDTLGDRVERHVDDRLERRRGKPRARPRSSPPPEGAVPARASTPPPSPSPSPPAPPHPDDALPHRVFGRHLRIDPTAALGYRHWLTRSTPTVDVALQGYPVWSVGVRALLFKLVSVERLALESSGLSLPGRPEAGVASRAVGAVPQAATLLGAVGLPLDFVVWPYFRYELRAFATTVTPSAPVVVVAHATSPDVDPATLPATTEPLRVTSAFETIVAGVRYDHDRVMDSLTGSKPGTVPPLYLGLGYTRYSKPYVLDVGGVTLDGFVWDARFEGLGPAFGFFLPQRASRFWLDVAVQTGLGQIELLDGYTLNQALPGNWLVGYLQGDATLGYLHPITRTTPTLLGSLSVTAGGATFFAFRTTVEEGEEVDAPPLTWDLLWSVRAGLALPL